MNDKKIAFIICTNNESYLNECLNYISVLNVPQNFEADVITIKDAKSMAAGYNEAMHSNDAKYKVYMHQDVFIINKNFIEDCVSLFEADKSIGMMGMVGHLNLAKTGMMWESYMREPRTMYGTKKYKDVDITKYQYDLTEGGFYATQIDGLMMVTAYDLEWNEDLLQGWDFYDAFQSVNFIEHGYKVVIPKQDVPWVIHDDGIILTMWNYGKYSRRFVARNYKYFGMLQNEMMDLVKQEEKILRMEFECNKSSEFLEDIYVLILADSIKMGEKVKECYISTQNIPEDSIQICLLEEYPLEPLYAKVLNDIIRNKLEDKSLFITTTRYLPIEGSLSLNGLEEELERGIDVIGTNWDRCLISNRLLKNYEFNEELVEPQKVIDEFIGKCKSKVCFKSKYSPIDTGIANAWESIIETA